MRNRVKNVFLTFLFLLIVSLASGQSYHASDTNAISYFGSWRIPDGSGSGCNCAFSSSQGDFLEFTFTGTSFTWIGEKIPTHGKALIKINGVLMDTVDQSGESAIKIPVYSVDLNYGPHKVTIEILEKYSVIHEFIVEDKSGLVFSETYDTIPDKMQFQITEDIKIVKKIQNTYKLISSDTVIIDTLGFYDMTQFILEAQKINGRSFLIRSNQPAIVYFINSEVPIPELADKELFKTIAETNNGVGIIDAGSFLIHDERRSYTVKITENDYKNLYLMGETNGRFSNILLFKD